MKSPKTSRNPEEPNSLWVGDAHLTRRIWSGKKIYGDAFWAFEWAISLALTRYPTIRQVFFAGDLLDSDSPTSEEVEVLRRGMDRLLRAGVEPVVVHGNHDYATPSWIESICPEATHLHKKSLRLTNGEQVYGLDWTPAEDLQEALATIPAEADILLCHQAWAELRDKAPSSEGTLADVPHVNTVFTGDLHKRMVVKATGFNGQRITAVSPGATHLRKIDEPIKHYVYLRLNNKTWQKVQIEGRYIRRQQVHTEQDLEELLDNWPAIEEELWKAGPLGSYDPEEITDPLLGMVRMPLLILRYAIEIPRAEKRLKKAVQTVKLLAEPLPTKELEEALSEADVNIATVGKDSLLELLPQRIPPTDPLFQPCKRLITTAARGGDLRKVLADLREARGIQT